MDSERYDFSSVDKIVDHCTDPRCDDETGCKDICRRKGDMYDPHGRQPWTIWPDGGEFENVQTPDLIEELREAPPGRDIIKRQRWGRVLVANQLPGLPSIQTESNLEFNFALHMWLDPDVRQFGEQPQTLTLVCSGKSTLYTPDFWVDRKGTLFYVEVKPEEMLADPIVEERHYQANRHLARDNIQFVVITDRMINDAIPLRNAQLIYRYRQCPHDTLQLDKMRAFLGEDMKPFGAVEKQLGGIIFRAYIFRAMLTKHIGYMPQVPITPHAPIWWRNSDRRRS